MNVVEEHIAAILLEYVRIAGDGKKGSFTPNSAAASLKSQFGVPVGDETMSRVLDGLVEVGCATKSYSPLTNGFYLVNRDHAIRLFGASGWTEADGKKFEKLTDPGKIYPAIFAYLTSPPEWSNFVVAELQQDIRLKADVPPDLDSIDIPASDRIVTLNDNQATELADTASDLINKVELVNSIDGDDGIKRKILGELKAGRELIRAQTLNAYLLYRNLLSALGKLIETYKGQAIGETAKQLWALLLRYIFIGS